MALFEVSQRLPRLLQLADSFFFLGGLLSGAGLCNAPLVGKMPGPHFLIGFAWNISPRTLVPFFISFSFFFLVFSCL